MEEPSIKLARILVKGEKQALEWSLVLASQGLEAVINHDPEAGEWQLLLPDAEIGPALRHLRSYRVENRGWPWQQPVFDHAALFDWACLGWVAIGIIFLLLSEASPVIKTIGRMNGELFFKGEWWRPFTATWLHGDAAHLASNIGIGLPLLGLAMGRYGTGVGALAAWLAGAAGNLFAVALAPHPHNSLGASGVVMGCLGLVAMQSWPLITAHPHSVRFAIGGLLGGTMLFVLLGLSPGTDILAHLGGFLAGLILGWMLAHSPNLTRNRAANVVAGLVAAGLIIGPWWAAFRTLPPP